MTTTRAVWLFIAALTAIRFSLLATTDLSFDEAHYWMWSERLAPAYFSKGPGIAFAIRASTALFGANEFGVRFFSPVLAAATSLLLFYFARRLFGATAGLWAVIGLNATPIFNIGAVVMTIDALSIFFWMAAMFTFWLALDKSPNFSWYWPLTGLLIGLCSVLYPLLIAAIGRMVPGHGNGERLFYKGRVVGYKLVGQSFTADHYFQSRPSAVNYNAGGSGGSNKSLTNPEYEQVISNRIDTFLVHNPGIDRKDIPVELVTASGSGLDPDLSPAAALIQVKRIARIRGLSEQALTALIAQHTTHHWLAPTTVAVLPRNIALDELATVK